MFAHGNGNNREVQPLNGRTIYAKNNGPSFVAVVFIAIDGFLLVFGIISLILDKYKVWVLYKPYGATNKMEDSSSKR